MLQDDVAWRCFMTHIYVLQSSLSQRAKFKQQRFNFKTRQHEARRQSVIIVKNQQNKRNENTYIFPHRKFINV